MRKLASIFIIITFLVLPLQNTSAQTAETTDAQLSPYAQSLLKHSNQVYKPQNALGAPDQNYADFFRKETFLLLDMGRLTKSDLRIHYKLLDAGSKYRVEFKDVNLNNVHIGGEFFPLMQTTSTIDYPDRKQPYRFVFVFNPAAFKPFKLDAVELTEPDKTITPPKEETEQPSEDDSTQPEEDNTTQPDEPTGPQPGNLISLPDDGDFATQADSAVYIVSNDDKRHAFPDVTTYMSWYNEFDRVEEVDTETLSSLPLGKNVTIRPGTYLVKTQTSPKVYAVEPGGTLRWIKTEQLAEKLYGSNWKNRLTTIPDVFLFNYKMGDPIETAVHPTGTLGSTPTGETVYIQNGTMYTISGMQMEELRFSPAFTVNLTTEEMSLYVDGGDLDFADSLTYPQFTKLNEE